MRVYKFGGASLANAERIANLVKILRKEGTEGLVLVVSAMGKTTNKIEQILSHFLQGKDYQKLLHSLEEEYQNVSAGLFCEPTHFSAELTKAFQELEQVLIQNREENYNFLYDQVVSFGELLTSKLVATYLNEQGLENTLLDARKYIQTDATYRDATVDWEQTNERIQKVGDKHQFFVTQGFIAGTNEGNTTTLGREGSDYSAGIFAYCLGASEVVIWKDVDGVLNADPRHFQDTVLLEQVSFNEAIELAYYGASIIHPKTIQPLHSKNIALKVRSFLNPNAKGTKVSAGKDLVPNVPCYILKEKQHLLQISTNDFSFIVENDIRAIFKTLCETQMKVNLLHNSAISLGLCIDDRLGDIEECVKILSEKYKVKHQENVTLYTIRNFNEDDFSKRFGEIQPILRQSKDDVVHIIIEGK
ncbi:MAG: aspartate kinase [Flavobacteriaceae bacterium]|nr:aspartate kinase [Flavobacteriaceae bacterium]